MSTPTTALPTPPTMGARINHAITLLPFIGVHIAAVVGVLYYGWSWRGFALAIAMYYVRMFFVTGWYHRYFSHRTFKTSRVMQFIMAVLCTTSSQKGPIWWASHHRRHHKYSDLPGDPHSVKLDGFWVSHVGWIVSKKNEHTETQRVQDLLKYPELRLVDRFHVVPVILTAVFCFFAFGGMHGLLWGFFVSTVLLWHGTFTINSLSHVFGRRRYNTTDESKNSWWLAIITMGEGWHNNHHYYQASVNQGFMWWEYDVTYYILRAMSWVGLVWDLKTAPKHVVFGPDKIQKTTQGTVAAAEPEAMPEPAE